MAYTITLNFAIIEFYLWALYTLKPFWVLWSQKEVENKSNSCSNPKVFKCDLGRREKIPAVNSKLQQNCNHMWYWCWKGVEAFGHWQFSWQQATPRLEENEKWIVKNSFPEQLCYNSPHCIHSQESWRGELESKRERRSYHNIFEHAVQMWTLVDGLFKRFKGPPQPPHPQQQKKFLASKAWSLHCVWLVAQPAAHATQLNRV